MNENVSFEADNNNYASGKQPFQKKDPAIIAFLIRKKIVTDTAGANRLLISVIIILLLISAVIFGYYYLNIGNPVQIRYSVPPELQGQLINQQNQ